MAYAYCYQSGHIDFVKRRADLPAGTIVFAKGKNKALRETVETRARHAYDGETLLVPGVPEADTADLAFRAFIAWQKWSFPDHEWFAVEGLNRAATKGGA